MLGRDELKIFDLSKKVLIDQKIQYSLSMVSYKSADNFLKALTVSKFVTSTNFILLIVWYVYNLLFPS